MSTPFAPRPYLPMEGLTGFHKACQDLVFGKNAPLLQQDRVATIATIGASGALKVGSEFIHKWFPDSKCYVSDPTWVNHMAIFEGSGMEVGSYPYYDPETGGIKFDELIRFLETLNKNDVVLLHPCCHNPTGVDLTHEQWDKLLAVVKEHELITFMDIAYQGFGEDLDSDAYAIRKAVELDLPVFVSNSYSKNLSLYGERAGGLSIVCPTPDERVRVFGQLKLIVRKIYSNPPSHGGHVVDIVMNDAQLYEQWVGELYAMRDRIKAMRFKLKSVLEAKLPGHNWDYLTTQKGMFSYTGLSPQQVERLRAEYGIYLLTTSRMCIAGLNIHNVDYVASAMAEVLKD